jgi:phenylacetate-CoA ligase
MREALYRGVFYPAYHGLKRDGVNRARQELERNQWLSMDAVAALQHRKLADLLSFAAKNVPYYRALFESLQIPLDGKAAAAEIGRLPHLTKQIVREHHDALVSEDLADNELFANSTSGSTGEAFRFFTDQRSITFRKAAGQRGDTWTGWRLGDRSVSLWGASIDAKKAFGLRGRLRDLIRGHRFLSSFDLSASMMDKYVDIVRGLKPILFLSYPGPMEVFALHCQKRGIRFPSLECIVCSAETLWPHQRKTIEEAFGVEVFDRYGCREVGHIASECREHDGLHISSDRLFLEVVDDQDRPCAPGETGRILVTDLDNYGMPLIRYDIGDRAVVSERSACACGRGLPMLESIEGRTLEIVVTPDGRQIGGTFWTLLLRSRPGFDQFQVVQEDVGGVTIKFVANSELTQSSLEYFRSRIEEYCGHDFRVEYAQQEKIDLTGSGKQRVIISLLEK